VRFVFIHCKLLAVDFRSDKQISVLSCRQLFKRPSFLAEPGYNPKIPPDKTQLIANGLADGFCPVLSLFFNGQKGFSGILPVCPWFHALLAPMLFPQGINDARRSDNDTFVYIPLASSGVHPSTTGVER
jgi:hypothetical protein